MCVLNALNAIWSLAEVNLAAALRLVTHRQTSKGEVMATGAQKRKVHKVMREKKRGTLRSGSGRKVKSRRQAIAIALSESGQSRRRQRRSSRRRSR